MHLCTHAQACTHTCTHTLSLFLSLPLSLSVSVSVLSVCLSALFLSLSVSVCHLCLCLSVCVSVSLCACLSVSLSLSLSFSLSISLSLSLSVSLSLSLSLSVQEHTDHTQLNLHDLKWAANRDLDRWRQLQDQQQDTAECRILPAFTLGHSRMGVSRTQLGCRVGLSRAFIPLHIICCLEHVQSCGLEV